MALKKSKSGLEILGDITWGSHFCLFYELKEDLLEVLIPYFIAGLENNEYCMWVTSEPLTAKDAENAIRKALPNFEQYLKKKQIEIIPYTDWYIKNNEFDSQAVLKGWVDKLDSALNNGFVGLRLTGNTFWLEKKDWKNFADYEVEVNDIIGNYHMIAVCTYSLEKCGAYEIIDVIRNHQFALIRREGKWDYFKSMEQIHLEQKLKESEENYRLITENANDLIAIINQKSEIEYINEEIHKNLMGYAKDEAIGNSIVDIVHPDDIKKAIDIIRKVFKTGEGSVELRIKHKDGSWKWLESKLKAFSDSKNEEKIMIISRDITKRKKAEQKLKESEKRYRNIVENTKDAIVVFGIDGNLKYISPQLSEILGREIKLESKIFTGIHPDDIINLTELFSQAVREKGIFTNKDVEFRALHKEDHYIWLSSSTKNYYDENGNLIGFISSLRDVSEKRKAEDKLKESEANYRSLFDNMLDGFAYCKIITDENNEPVDFIYLEVNDAFERLTGLKKENTIGKKVSEVIPGIENSEPNLFEIYGKVALTGEPREFEIFFTPLKIWLSIAVYSPQKGYFVAVFDNITERKTAEQKIIDSEEKFRTAVRNNPDFMVFIKADGTIFDVNRLEKGFTREMVIGQSVFNRDFYETEDQLESAQKAISDSIETGKTTSYEYSQLAPDGSQSFYETRISPFEYDHEDKTISLQLSTRDITEHKKMITEIQAHEQELSAIYKYAPTPIILVDGERRVRKANRLALEFANRSQDEITGLRGGEALKCLNSLNDPQGCGFGVECQTCNVRNTVLDTFNTGNEHYNVEANLPFIIDKEKKELSLLVSTFPVKIRDEKLVLVSLNDVSERKKVEQRLKQIEWLLKTKPRQDYSYMPSYGRLDDLNTGGEILNLVGKDVLTDIVINYLDLLDTSAAVYEKNGDYALGLSSSGWCRSLDTASRNLCETDNNLEALKCGKWLCHESCWEEASKAAIKTGKPVDIECNGGIHIYALPIFVEEEIIGSINFGYGDPPKDPLKLKEIAENYQVNVNELVEHAIAYESRPEFIIDLAKKRLNTSTRLIKAIVERKKAEEVIKHAYSELDQVFNTSLPMYVIDTDFNIKRVNNTFSSFFQIRKEEMIGKKCYEIWKGHYCNTPKCSLCQILGGKEEYEYEIEKEVNLGKNITCISKTVPYLNADGKTVGAIKFFIDITERKEVEELKSKMITRFSHEFKTPLVAIKGNLDLLIKEYGNTLNAEILHLLINAKDGSDRLQNLINSFIESSQLGVKLVKLNLENGNLNALIRFCLEELKGLIEWRRHTVNLDIEEELIFNFDKKKVKEVISNIVLNAINYTPPGGKISINSRIEDNSVVIFIKDNGIGLPEEDKTHLFKEFGKIERYGQGWDILNEGSGMGLYISKELIELHGGKVWVESEGKNKGSTFYFSLPLIK